MCVCPACQFRFTADKGNQILVRCPRCNSQLLDTYCDLDRVGGGGMGDVYRARDPSMGNRIVAIKIPKVDIDFDRACHRFEREIAASARLQHENAARAYHRGLVCGRPYLVMEFVKGARLSEVIRRQHPLTPRRVAAILLGISRGLAHAACQGVINRDLKPDNVILAEPDETPKILDYGLALIVDLEEQVTRYGAVLGTPNYAPPEQFRDPHSVDIRADVYSLGCTGYFCLTSQPPFLGANLDALYELHSNAPRPSVRESRPDVDPRFERLLQQMISPSAADRPMPDRLVVALEQLLPDLSDIVPETVPEADSSMIDVVCPACGTEYHLFARLRGRRIRCENKLCQTVFQVAPADNRIADVELAPQTGGEPGSRRQSEPDEPQILSPDALESDLLAQADPELVEGQAVPSASAEPAMLAAEVVDSETIELPVVDGRLLEAEPIDEAEILDPELLETPASGTVGAATERSPGVTIGGRREAGRRGARRAREASPRPRRSTVSGWPWMKILAFLVLGASMAVAVIVVLRAIEPPDPDKEWAEIEQLIESRKFLTAKRRLTSFEERFPENEHLPLIPFLNDFCDAGDDIYSSAGDPAKALAIVQEMFKKHRDNPAYASYASHLCKALAQLIDYFLTRKREAPSAADISQAREACGLLQTVSASVNDPAKWSPDTTDSLASKIEQADAALRLATARSEVLQRFRLIDEATANLHPDDLYREYEQVCARYPSLREDRELRLLLRRAVAFEPQRIRFSAEPPEEEPAEAMPDRGRQGETLVIIWGGAESQADPADPENIQLALARGILYAFDHRGAFRWARRLGLDSSRLPNRLPASPLTPASLIAICSEDNSLLSLDPGTGRVRWRYAVGGDIYAPMTVVPRHTPPGLPARFCGFLPTAEGEIHVLELVLGKRLGRLNTGQPMTVEGFYDPQTHLCFFPADARRIFALDPAAVDDPKVQACRSVLFTEHASGSLRSAPTVVGQYLILSETSELEHCNLKAFDLCESGFRDPRASPLKAVRLRGWAWFAPHCTPDRITIASDQGDMGIFGLNLDNLDEAIYPIIRSDAEKPLFRIDPRAPHCTLAVTAREHLLWVMAGGRLHKLAIDLLHQRIYSLWSQGEDLGVSGVPVHEAGVDRRTNTLYLTSMASGGEAYYFSSVDMESGRRHWQRQLGISLLGDPIVAGDLIVLLDRNGQSCAIRPREHHRTFDLPVPLCLPRGGDIPAGADPGKMLLIGDEGPGLFLVAPLAGGQRVAVRSLSDPNGLPSWTVLNLPEPLQGRPCVCSQWLVVPCADGQIHRVRLDNRPGDLNEMSADWAQSKPPGPNSGEIYRVSDEDILLVDSRRRIRHLHLSNEEGITRYVDVGPPCDLGADLRGRPLVRGKEILAFDAAGKLSRLDLDRPALRKAEHAMELNVTAGPFVRDDAVLLVVNGNRLARLDVEAGKIRWMTEPFRGRIHGRPVLAGRTLLVADDSRRVTGLNLDNGEAAWQSPLELSVGPNASPVPYGPHRMLIPLVDGTLLVTPIPQPKAEEASE